MFIQNASKQRGEIMPNWYKYISYISLHLPIIKAFAMALGDGTKCKTCFGCPGMVLCGP